MDIDSPLAKELANVLNRHSAENGSDTPDFLLAQFLLGCLDVWNSTVVAREEWYGRYRCTLEEED